MIFCTQLTFDLFLRLRSNYRLGIHPYVFCHISRNNISMGRIMYSILPSKVKISVFFPMGLPTNTHEHSAQFIRFKIKPCLLRLLGKMHALIIEVLPTPLSKVCVRAWVWFGLVMVLHGFQCRGFLLRCKSIRTKK